MDTKFNQVGRNYEGVDLRCNKMKLSIFKNVGSPIRRGIDMTFLASDDWIQLRLYVLKNFQEVERFVK